MTREHPLVKTTSKSNLGHTEICAGINGLIKCVEMGLSATAAPNIHLRLLNHHIDNHAYPVYFNSEFVDQGKDSGCLGVSSFGFGGSNARSDIWVRAMSGPHNTQPGKCSFDYGPQRILSCITMFGKRTMPLPGVTASTTESGNDDVGFTGDYVLGSHLDDGMRYYFTGSANGWSLGEMSWDPAQKCHTFAMTLGEAFVEQFQICCDGYDDLKIFPAEKLAESEEVVLGPGVAPKGHTWLIDGRKDQVGPGSVYEVKLWWDSGTNQKRISWAPSKASKLIEQASLNVVHHSYYLSGSWTAFRPVEMTASKSSEKYEATLRIGQTGFEEFQFLRDADELQAIYPAEKGGRSTEVRVLGPDSDSRGKDKFWRIVGSCGEVIQIQLQISNLNGELIVSITGGNAGKKIWRSSSSRQFYVIGGWAKQKFSRMSPIAMSIPGLVSAYRLTLKMSDRGHETFQIVADQDLSQVLHPELPQCDQLISHVVGPDAEGLGLEWQVTGNPGDLIEIRLDLFHLQNRGAGVDRRKAVTWQTVS
eukprot:TRINITY_DN8880_c0_g3_i6.p1 TRINITY_DN8880_c0_g3~~TRINITY_DN8880_c0_g3_i6.p1  ORF type:complete len:532 (-),score=65.35 TRINITY_DN8880_c0_g3_i6:78-1673(-)